MQRSFFWIFLVLSVCIFGCTRQVQETDPTPTPPTTQNTVAEMDTDIMEETPPGEKTEQTVGLTLEESLRMRQSLKNMWWSATQEVLDRINYPKANEVFEHITRNAVLVEPISNGSARLLESPPNDNVFLMILIAIESDLSTDQYLARIVNEGVSGALFTNAPPLITLYPGALSPAWRAIMLLHEGWHAQSWYIEPHNFEDREAFAIEEVRAHDFENEILSRLGGEDYSVILTDEMARIRTMLSSLPPLEEGQIALVGRTEYDIRMDHIFGPAQSDFERDLRQTHMWVHAQFALIEERMQNDTPENVVDAKARWYDVLRTSHEE